MSQQTAIEWTDHTFNPWWGCTKLSPGCTNCYADTLSTRYGHNVWGPRADRRFFGENHWKEPVKWNTVAKRDGIRRRVFCASMSDVFERHMDPDINNRMDAERSRLWDMIEATPMLDWLLLTKRPSNIGDMMPERWLNNVPDNIWLGTSCENQEQADIRIPELLAAPTPAVRFLSCEPLLSSVNLQAFLHPERLENDARIDWVIVGGESGVRARPIEIEWVRVLRDQCTQVNTAFFFKQWGGRTSKSNGRTLDDELWSQFPNPTITVVEPVLVAE